MIPGVVHFNVSAVNELIAILQPTTWKYSPGVFRFSDTSIFLRELKKVGYDGPIILHTFGLQEKPVSHYKESFKEPAKEFSPHLECGFALSPAGV